jgi:hypothetical protein
MLMEKITNFYDFFMKINLSQQFCVLEVIFATMPPGLGLTGEKLLRMDSDLSADSRTETTPTSTPRSWISVGSFSNSS